MFLSLFFSFIKDSEITLLATSVIFGGGPGQTSNRMPSTWQPGTLPLSYSLSAKRFFAVSYSLKIWYIYAICIDRINLLLPPPTCATYLIYLSISWLKIFVNGPVSLIIAIHVCVDMWPSTRAWATYQWPFSQKKTLIQYLPIHAEILMGR